MNNASECRFIGLHSPLYSCPHCGWSAFPESMPSPKTAAELAGDIGGEISKAQVPGFNGLTDAPLYVSMGNGWSGFSDSRKREMDRLTQLGNGIGAVYVRIDRYDSAMEDYRSLAKEYGRY